MTEHHSINDTYKGLSKIKAALEKALAFPIKHGCFSLVVTYRDSKVIRFTTSHEESFLIEFSTENCG